MHKLNALINISELVRCVHHGGCAAAGCPLRVYIYIYIYIYMLCNYGEYTCINECKDQNDALNAEACCYVGVHALFSLGDTPVLRTTMVISTW